ncbi:Putative aminoglycoside phosphotransferase, protein kinase-like domain superfamily [Septoria linicola]|uniref:Altered inheritance of mitochondria protein 9, mitochondrial n=1 Tax=Septoria linicola TaxID=215465 RepID=A0A9Q9AMU4_9PEZI|nr:putative aminoglycoside phosphotransferase, protein kinase-like domain superfamily [Septoria linicola]USW48846.1 Putative aminoglycoside phosphotransferase, protein kinase-like domain superfamily [Septoria linicola]
MRSIRWNRSLPTQAARRRLTVTCRGSTISREDLYRYTNGSFLTDETNAVSRRYLKFDLDELCSIASRIGSTSAIREVEKIEGGFSRALLLKKLDGTEVVAKLPFSIAGPAYYTTASEVAVMQYIRQHTKVPVPKILAWSSNQTNVVGAEYIIMEKAPGIQLVKVFDKMRDYDHFMLIKNLCALESELAAIEFPASGSLYLRQSLQDSNDVAIPLDISQDPEGQFCIGPACDRTWNDDRSPAVRKGPWPSLPAFGQALVEREIARTNSRPDNQEPGHSRSPSKAEQIATLQLASDVATRMAAESLPGKFASPTLWHSDLHLGNIYVSEEDPTQIVSIIDWQSLLVLPLFCQVRFPEFLDLPEDYEIGAPVPDRPEKLDEMEEDDRLIAEHEYKQACLGKAYEAASGFKNKQVYKALRLPTYYKDFLERCGEVSEEGIVPLRACLIELPKGWEESDLAGECPIEFTPEDLLKHEEEFEDYSSFHRIRAIAREYLDTDTEGWIPPGTDIEFKRNQNQKLLQLMMKRSAEYGKTPEEVRQIWPF